MKRSIQVLGIAVALVLGAGCSRESRQVNQPAPSTFESSVEQPSESGAQTGQGAQTSGTFESQQGMTGQDTTGQGMTGQQGMGQQGMGQQGMTGQQGMGQQGMTGQMGTDVHGTGSIDPQALCNNLGRDAKISSQDIPGGVRLVFKAQDNTNIATVRSHVQQIQMHIAHGQMGHQGGQMGQQGMQGQQGQQGVSECSLYSLGRQYGFQVASNDTGDEIHVTMTTQDPGRVKSLRDQARVFANTYKTNR